MSFHDFLCLAKSRKLGRYCVAGKDCSTGEWIRPVSDAQGGALGSAETMCLLKDSGIREELQLLDFVRVPTGRRVPCNHQGENIAIRNENWEKLGAFNFLGSDIEELLDHPEAIWMFPGETHRDRVSLAAIKQQGVSNSLYFVKVSEVLFHRTSTNFSERRVEARFTYNGLSYVCVVTDPYVESDFFGLPKGRYVCSYPDVYFCMSLGEPFEGCCYKLIAGVICFNRHQQSLPCSRCSSLLLRSISKYDWKDKVKSAITVVTDKRIRISQEFHQEMGIRIIDKRSSGGRLWVTGNHPRLAETMKEFRDSDMGLPFQYAAGGGKATNYQPGWWLDQ